MGSEKVKEIKKALEQNDYYGIMYEVDYKKRTCKFIHHKDILTLINELESENERLKQAVKDFAERLRKRIADTMYSREGYVDYDDTMEVIDETLKEYEQ